MSARSLVLAPRMMLLVAFAFASVATLMAAPASAAAATVSTAFGNSVFYSATSGEPNQVLVTASAGSSSGKKLVFQESGPGVTLTAPAEEPSAPGTPNGCTSTAGNSVTCDNLPASYAVAVAELDDMADTITATGSFQARGLRLDAQGGAGEDTMDGGDGNDTFLGNHSDNSDLSDDTVDGGAGFDTMSYFFATGPVTATANGTGGQSGETDTLTSVEGLWGSDGYDDVLTGDPGPNDFVGFGGNDTINADDGANDTVRCDGLYDGSAAGDDDTANLDAFDTLASDHGCETVNRSGDADGSPPEAPTGLSSTPSSPSDDNTPRITGTAEEGTTVRVYATADCSGEPAATGSAADFASPGLTVTVPDNSTTTFRATSTGAGGSSPCSTSSVTYREASRAGQGDGDGGGGQPERTSPGAAPSITGLAVARRCVRSATLTAPRPGTAGLSFSFSLSQDATIRYEIRRRNGSPRWTFCPRRGGKRAGTYTRISTSRHRRKAGDRNTSLANTASRRGRRDVLRLRQGRRHLSLARAAAGRKLPPGTYVLRMTATNANGRSVLVSVKFWVLGPRR